MIHTAEWRSIFQMYGCHFLQRFVLKSYRLVSQRETNLLRRHDSISKTAWNVIVRTLGGVVDGVGLHSSNKTAEWSASLAFFRFKTVWNSPRRGRKKNVTRAYSGMRCSTVWFRTFLSYYFLVRFVAGCNDVNETVCRETSKVGLA